jgi:hypothetical protein
MEGTDLDAGAFGYVGGQLVPNLLARRSRSRPVAHYLVAIPETHTLYLDH